MIEPDSLKSPVWFPYPALYNFQGLTLAVHSLFLVNNFLSNW